MDEFRKPQIEALKSAKQVMIDSFDKSISSFKEAVVAEEVTYSTGDRFLNNRSGKYILSKVYPANEGKVTLISLQDGRSYGTDNFSVGNTKEITQKEMNAVFYGNGGFITRYWDANKQCRC
jgi:hypothetical protein